MDTITEGSALASTEERVGARESRVKKESIPSCTTIYATASQTKNGV